MKHYELHLQQDMDAIRSRVGAVAAATGKAIDDAISAIAAFDKERLYAIILADHPINRETRSIDQACHQFVARHLPAAGPLRFISSVLRIDIAIERVGDYAVTIGRIGVQLHRPYAPDVLESLRSLADHSVGMLEAANRAWLEQDVTLARETIQVAKQIDIEHDQLFFQTVERDLQRPLIERVGLLSIYARLERVSDQAKNICEEAIFVATGETKASKVYRIHFVGKGNDLYSQLAEALAKKAFPNSGRFSSSGVEPTGALHPALVRVADKLRLDLDAARPTPLRPMRETPAEYHVLVLIDDGLELPIPRIPFHTVLQRWNVGPLPADEGAADAQLEEVARDLSARIRELMVLLRGESAS